MAAGAVDVSVVNAIVRHAVEGIDVNKQGQTLTIKGPGQLLQPPTVTLTEHDMQYVVNLLQHHPLAVDNLVMEFLILTRQAVDVLEGHFSRYTMTRKMPLRYISFDTVNLGNDNCGRLLSRLRGNNSLIKFHFNNVGLEGRRGGEILSDLLQHNPQTIQVLSCHNLHLGVEGARALQPGIRANRTTDHFKFSYCRLGDEGTSLIVNAIHDRNIAKVSINFSFNDITPNALPSITRSLPLIRNITIDDFHRGIFNDQEKSGHFLTALQNAQEICGLNLCYRDMPGPVVTALFQAMVNKTKPIILAVYDFTRLEGEDLERLLEIIPLMKNLQKLSINLDFMDAAVLNSFRQNTSIQSLVTYNNQQVTSGPVMAIVKRNRRLSSVTTLLDSERERELPWGLWSNALGQLTREHDDNTSTVATTVYKIMQEKLAMWCAPDQAASSTANHVASSTSSTTPTIAAAAAAAASPFSSTTTETGAASSMTTNNDTTTTNNNSTLVLKKRSYAHNNNNTTVDNDDNDGKAQRK